MNPHTAQPFGDQPVLTGLRAIVIKVLATGFGAGYSPMAPGTAGTITAALFYALVLRPWTLAPYLVFLAFFIVLAILVAGRAEPLYGKRDASFITIDEWAGFFVTMAPAVGVRSGVGSLAAAGFVAFRVFDVLKPWPAGWIDRLKNGGASVVLDDVAAGLYAAAIVGALRATGWLTAWP